MSEYGVKVGCYKFTNGDADAGADEDGRIVHIKKTTKKFVEVDIYNFYNNKYSLVEITSHESDKIDHLCFKKKQIKWSSGGNGSLFINSFNHYILSKHNYLGDNTYVEVDTEEQPPTPDDGTADYDIDEQLEKEKEPIIEKIFSTEVDEIINDSIMKDPEVCKMLAKNHILEILFNELFKNPCPYKTQDKYYIEVCNAIHKL